MLILLRDIYGDFPDSTIYDHKWRHFWQDFAYTNFGILYAYLTTHGYVVDY